MDLNAIANLYRHTPVLSTNELDMLSVKAASSIAHIETLATSAYELGIVTAVHQSEKKGYEGAVMTALTPYLLDGDFMEDVVAHVRHIVNAFHSGAGDWIDTSTVAFQLDENNHAFCTVFHSASVLASMEKDGYGLNR